jgi:hypothetical protein
VSRYILLAIAQEHGALFGIETVEDLTKFNLSSGKPIELRQKDKYLEMPVLGNVTADGPQGVHRYSQLAIIKQYQTVHSRQPQSRQIPQQIAYHCRFITTTNRTNKSLRVRWVSNTLAISELHENSRSLNYGWFR